MLRTEAEIVNVTGEFSESPGVVAGRTIFENQFVTLHTAIGRRFRVKNTDFDFMVGPEIGFNTASNENGRAETEKGTLYSSNRERRLHDSDVRLRTSLAVYYNKFGLTTGYSYGLTNYSAYLIGANRKRYSRFIRFGLTYRFQKP